MLTMIKVGDRVLNSEKVRSVVLQNEPDPEISQSAPYVAVFFDSEDIMYFYGDEATAVWHYFQGAATSLLPRLNQEADVLRHTLERYGATPEEARQIAESSLGLRSEDVIHHFLCQKSAQQDEF